MEQRGSLLENKLLRVIMIITSLIYTYTSGFGLFSAMTQRGLLITLLLPTVFITHKLTFGKKKNIITQTIDYISLIGLLASGIYILVVWKDRILKVGNAPVADIIMGTIMMVLILEVTRRVVGKFITFTAIFFIIYALFGEYFPTFLAHRSETWKSLVTFLYTTTEGIFGIPLGIAATFIIMFVIFGAFLEAFGGGQWFIDIAYILTGKYRGGPAKTAVVASALMGMISGAPAANVATTGTFTIPLMKKTGYKPHVAGAIEAVASTGGIFTPPIMGAAAFIMAEYLNKSYTEIIIAATIPALLFYAALILTVDARAVKNGLVGLSSSELPNLKKVLTERGLLGLPVILIIFTIMIGWSPMKAAFWATTAVLLVAFTNKNTRPKKQDILNALEKGSSQIIPIVASCATAGIIVGVIAMTGLGAKLSYTLINVSNGSIYIAAFMTAIIALILGCGMPPTAVYIILASILAPPLIKLGAVPIAAHLFIFMFAAVGALTPPVAITAYTGAAIAKADPNKTGFTAFRFGLPAYIIPFMFITSPAIILQGNISSIIISVTTAAIGILCLVAALEGYFLFYWSKISRILLGISSLALLWPGEKTDIIGIGIIIISMLINKKKFHKSSIKEKDVIETN